MGNPSSGSVNQSPGGSWATVASCSIQTRGNDLPVRVWQVLLSRTTSIFAKHLFIVYNNSTTSSALALSFCTAWHLSVRAFPISFMRIHWMLSAVLSVCASWGVLVSKRFRSRISWTIISMCVVWASARHPSSFSSRISSLCFSSCFAKRGGQNLPCTTNHECVFYYQRF